MGPVHARFLDHNLTIGNVRHGAHVIHRGSERDFGVGGVGDGLHRVGGELAPWDEGQRIVGGLREGLDSVVTIHHPVGAHGVRKLVRRVRHRAIPSMCPKLWWRAPGPTAKRRPRHPTARGSPVAAYTWRSPT